MGFTPNIKICCLFILLLLSGTVKAQNNKENPYGLKIISTVEGYRESIRNDSLKRLVDLEKTVPGIMLDIRYATSNNFTHKIVYTESIAYLRESAALALKEVQKELNKKGIGLKVYDAYRPYAATLLFWKITGDTLFVAAPWKGSRHNRGCAADVGLVDLKTGKDLEMPTPFDDFSAKAGAYYADLPQKAKENRDLLIRIMNKHGFSVFPSEWWHFDFRGWENYELMDLSFEELN
jgi:zinc D-Ala-D-Ala dipeptidase